MKSITLSIRLTLILVLLPMVAAQGRDYQFQTEYWLARLDSAVSLRETYNAQKRDRLNQLQTLGKGLHELSDLYEHNCRVYDECFTFDSELAMSLVDMNYQIARQLNDKEGQYQWQINRSFILASTGQLLEASKTLDSINVSCLPRLLRQEFYSQQEYLYSHLNQYSWSERMKQEYQSRMWVYTDSIYSTLMPEDENYLWYQTWSDYSKGDYDLAISRLKPVVDTLKYQTRKDAMLCYALARLYQEKGDRDAYLQYMARSGISDLRAGNQDIASLEELASVLYELNDLSRAYIYINVCLETSRLYNNLVRTVSIARVMDRIVASYRERDIAQQRHRTIALWVMAMLLLAFVIAMCYVWLQHKRIYAHRQLLHEANVSLKQANEKLERQSEKLTETNSALTEANRRLSESNFVKEEYIGYVFALCSSYISKMDEYRKNINRKAKVKLFDEILQMTEKQSLVQEELKEFYQNFDAIFLHIYPDFVEDFNQLLLPEAAIEPRKGELLNTDLRIYALVRLGISDSVKIAEFLHCSTQTVYNNRLKIRNRAKVDKDHFADYVRALGRPAR